MNMVYICNDNLEAQSFIGIKNKVYGQLKSFKNEGYSVYLIYTDNIKCTLVELNSNNISYFLYTGKENLYNFIIEKCHELEPRVIYFRKSLIIDYFLFDFYMNLRNKCSISKMILEIPTMPYDSSIDNIDLLEIDKFYRNKIKDIFDISINYNNFEYIFGIKSFGIYNGIELNNIPIKINKKDNKDEINLIFVGSLNIWHGLERIFEGLKKYYEKIYEKLQYKIKISIVGDGSEFDYLNQITKTYNLDKYIEFKNILDGERLNEEFNNADIAIGSLGLYKVGLKEGSPLKIREYCARGIPFIIGYDELSINNDAEFILKFENNNSLINMEEIINFYHKIINIDNLSLKMRKYAEDNLTWDKNFKKLFEYIKCM